MKHDEIIFDIYSKLRGDKKFKQNYSFLCLNGECDLYTMYNKNLYIFEVKTTDNSRSRRKALEQLVRDYSYFFWKYGDKIKKVYLFYVYSCRNISDRYKIELIWEIDNTKKDEKYRRYIGFGKG